MREQTKKMNDLLNEFKSLKNKLFSDFKFVIFDHNDKSFKRYNQLFMFFYPSYRNNEYINPINNNINELIN